MFLFQNEFIGGAIETLLGFRFPLMSSRFRMSSLEEQSRPLMIVAISCFVLFQNEFIGGAIETKSFSFIHKGVKFQNEFIGGAIETSR